MKKQVCWLLAAVVLHAPLFAQSAGTDSGRINALEKRIQELESPGNPRFWQMNSNGGELMVQIDRIGAISKSQYIIDGGVLVTEVTIDVLGGQSLTRIYHLAPVTQTAQGGTAAVAGKVVERTREVLDQASKQWGRPLHEMVQKSYPTTTHAHTVEFRVLELEDLDALYGSLRSAWVSGKGRILTLK